MAETDYSNIINNISEKIEIIDKRFIKGRNLFDKNAIQEYKNITDDGNIVDANSNGNCFDLSNWIPIKAGETIYFSNNGIELPVVCALFDSDKNFIERAKSTSSEESTNDEDYTFYVTSVTAASDGYVLFRLNHPSSIIDTVQAEIGTEITAYNAYHHDLPYNNGELKVSITEYGAIADGVTDSTLAIQNCINEISKMTETPVEETTEDTSEEATEEGIKTNYFGRNPVIVFPAGTYVVSKTITIPVNVSIELVGTVRIISDMDDRAVLHFTNANTQKDTPSTNLPWETQDNAMCKKVIIGGGNLVLSKKTKANYNADNKSVGILIGNSVHSDETLRCAGFDLNNITILGFNTAVKISPKDVYMITFNKLSVAHCYYGVLWGTQLSSENAGERIYFNNSVFSGCASAIVINSSLTSIGFNNCSFDFNVNQLSIYVNKAIMVSYNQCHIEGTGRNDINLSTDYPGFGKIVYKGEEKTENQETENQETENQETENQETENQETENQEDEKKEETDRKNVSVVFVDTFFVKNVSYISTTQFSSTTSNTLNIKMYGCYVYDDSIHDSGNLEAEAGVSLTVM